MSSPVPFRIGDRVRKTGTSWYQMLETHPVPDHTIGIIVDIRDRYMGTDAHYQLYMVEFYGYSRSPLTDQYTSHSLVYANPVDTLYLDFEKLKVT